MKYFMIGGPFDGQEIDCEPGCFEEGIPEAVNSIEHCNPGSEWSPESVYIPSGQFLNYDDAATRERNKITASDPSQLNNPKITLCTQN